MKKNIFKSVMAVTALTATVAGTMSMVGCKKASADPYIVIGVQQTSGNNYESMCNLLDSLKGDLHFTYKTVLLESRNNDANLTAFENAMLSGAQGIISMVDMDLANTSTLMTKCQQNKVYYAGYMSDFANTFTKLDSSNATEKAQAQAVANSPYMLGSVSDGEIDGAVRGEFLFNQIVKTTARKVTFARFPLYAYPSAAASIARFKELAEAYNDTHTDDFEYYTYEGGSDTFEIGFQMGTVPDATVTNWKNGGVEAVIAVNSLGKRILTPVNTANANIAIYQTGWDDSIVSSFPDKIKTLAQTPAETIVYPLVRLLNAIGGKSYADEPTNVSEKIVTGKYVYLTSTEDLNNGRQNSMNFSTDHSASRSIISATEIKALLAGEEGASFAKLVNTLASWDSQYALTRTH